ncbi:hypothetical protein EV1_007818 [Malus domestica]
MLMDHISGFEGPPCFEVQMVEMRGWWLNSVRKGVNPDGEVGGIVEDNIRGLKKAEAEILVSVSSCGQQTSNFQEALKFASGSGFWVMQIHGGAVLKTISQPRPSTERTTAYFFSTSSTSAPHPTLQKKLQPPPMATSAIREMDASDTVEESNDLKIIGEDVQDFGDRSFNLAPGVDTICVFPKNITKTVAAGKKTEILVGLKNDGKSSLNMIAIKASVHLHFDNNLLVQNLTAQGRS